MAERKTVVEMLQAVLDKQYELFETAAAENEVADMLDIGGELTKTAQAMLDAKEAEVLGMLTRVEE